MAEGQAQAVPEDFHTLTPHLVVRDAMRAIDFYERAFGAEEVRVHRGPGGRVMHATVRIGDSMVMLADEFPDFGVLSPLARGGTSVTLHLYVDDVDSAFERAISAGATVRMPVADQFWGDRYGSLVDPFGHQWSIATHIRDLSSEEIEEAGKAAFAEMGEHGA